MSGNVSIHVVDNENTLDNGKVKWIPVKARPDGAVLVASDTFTPSSYTGVVTVDTSAAGNSTAVATGATRLMVTNTDSTNFVQIAFGTSSAEAITNVANGHVVLAGATQILGIPSAATHFAYVADTASVDVSFTQGI